MACNIITEVWKLDLTPTKKLVMLAYANYADKQGNNTFPTYKHVSEMTGLHRNTVQKTVKQLIEDGHLEVQEKRAGRSTIYRIPLPADVLPPPPTDVLPVKEGYTPGGRGGAHLGVGGSYTQDVPVTVNNHKVYDTADAPASNEATDQKTIDDQWYEAIRDVWGYEGGRNVNMRKFLTGTVTDKSKKQYMEYQLPPDSGLTPGILRSWGIANKPSDPGVSMLSKLEKVQSSILAYLRESPMVSDSDPDEKILDWRGKPFVKPDGSIVIKMPNPEDLTYENIYGSSWSKHA